MPTTEFRTLVAVARRHAGMTSAEFDYSLAFPDSTDHRAHAAFGDAAYQLATEGLPEVTPGTDPAELRHRSEQARDLLAAHRADIAAMTATAEAKTYTGWSAASRGGIRYA